MKASKNKTVEVFSALLGGGVSVSNENVSNIIAKTRLEIDAPSRKRLISDLAEVKEDIFFFGSYKLLKIKKANIALARAKSLKYILQDRAKLTLDDEYVNSRLNVFEAQLDEFIQFIHTSLKVRRDRSSVVRAIIKGSIAQTYTASFGKPATTSIRDGKPSGPFVRFVLAVFSEFGPHLTPINENTIRQATTEQKDTA